ncbi:phosphoadenylyl-sulfate reductase [Paralimibaculum aggregatum]|uniref:Adenosine 5'-phosphosulfate reductase n=1 Tax=Paralimibaculum aggregatum TaxID=3036245 RepID=A0ABQ6LQI1_9RHOB|nr:phosphoadenylyl-sulfate reductase [Limibaculum sp. NKW23]GMG82825.1 phosphoadenylyl-sulfate reductase [Limibaculum sp. NKW23]
MTERRDQRRDPGRDPDRDEVGRAVPTPSRRLSARSAAEVLNRQHHDATAEEILADAIRDQYPGGIALVSSFGADAAVLLHMVSRIDRRTPVIFLETGMLFRETLSYQYRLASALGLASVRLVRPDPEDIDNDDPSGELHAENPDACCFLRKTLPLRRALEPYDAWITGRKRAQATTRAAMPVFEAEDDTRRLKINPLADWTAARIRAYMGQHALPAHPLVARGYPSIGCAPCTTPVAEGEDPRAGRWRGRGKTECGIHFDGTRWVRSPGASGVVSSFP